MRELLECASRSFGKLPAVPRSLFRKSRIHAALTHVFRRLGIKVIVPESSTRRIIYELIPIMEFGFCNNNRFPSLLGPN
jgi:hypothetical protein